ncbi:MAG: EAL domain-containing protein [Rhodospirillales bacterium]|nr:EAL domain-containing protein [Rhodospirillales bacterium]MBR9818060.1 EAL domain-containing protein [Rhodospirillales bacterium]
MSVAAAGLPTVLIVDDDENLLASVSRSLSGSFNLVKYINGEAALEWLSKNRSGVNIIVADLVMPTIDGISFLKRAFRCAPDIPRILLTGNISAVPMREANGLAKVSKILTKPISIATFKEVLFKTIEDKRKENHADQLIADTLNELLDRSAVTTAFQPRVRAEDFSRTGGEVLCRTSDVHKGYDIGTIIRQCQNQPVMDRLTMCLMDMTINSAPVYRKILGSGALLSLNLDYASVCNSQFVQALSGFVAEMQKYGLEVAFEIHEMQLGKIDENFIKNARVLADRGIRIFIDGFGADKGALELLRHEFFVGVKLDRRLIRQVMENDDTGRFISWIVQICRQIDYSVVATGVENEATALRLRSYGVDELQGYLFGMPQPIEEHIPSIFTK